jgi:pseudouridine-5'-monophosphatase
MGVPGSSTGDVFHAWAQLPIPRSQFDKEQKEEQRIHFPKCKPLPGAEKLLCDLKAARNTNGARVHIALATSTSNINYELKIQNRETKELLSNFADNRRITWEDPRLQNARGKPAPDIFLLALKAINESLDGKEAPIIPEECLVFEDSVPGVEAGRRAGMRVVWVPHPALVAEYKGKEELVLAGKVCLVKIGDEWQLGELDDGWGAKLSSLEEFPYSEFGISVSV